MKPKARIATACAAVALSVGSSLPAAQAMPFFEPNASSQAVGDAVFGSTSKAALSTEDLLKGTPLAPLAYALNVAVIPVLIATSMSSEQCTFADTRACREPGR